MFNFIHFYFILIVFPYPFAWVVCQFCAHLVYHFTRSPHLSLILSSSLSRDRTGLMTAYYCCWSFVCFGLRLIHWYISLDLHINCSLSFILSLWQRHFINFVLFARFSSVRRFLDALHEYEPRVWVCACLQSTCRSATNTSIIPFLSYFSPLKFPFHLWYVCCVCVCKWCVCIARIYMRLMSLISVFHIIFHHRHRCIYPHIKYKYVVSYYLCAIFHEIERNTTADTSKSFAFYQVRECAGQRKYFWKYFCKATNTMRNENAELSYNGRMKKKSDVKGESRERNCSHNMYYWWPNRCYELLSHLGASMGQYD